MVYSEVGTGQPLLLIHGWAMRGCVFEKQQLGLSAHFRVITPDLRGHGASDTLPNSGGIATLAEDLHQLLCRLDIHGALLVGWSMGAMVGWEYLRRFGAHRMAGMVVIDMLPKLLSDGEWQFGLREGRDASVFSGSLAQMRKDWPGYTDVFLPRIFARGKSAEKEHMIHWIRSQALDCDPESAARLWASMVEADYRSILSELKIPTLIVFGELSQLYPKEASEWLAESLSNGISKGFRHSGHAPHLEEPDRFNALVRNFCENLERTPSHLAPPVVD